MNSSSDKQTARPFEFPEVTPALVTHTVEGQLWTSAPEVERGPAIDMREAHDMAERARVEGRIEGEARVREVFEEHALHLREGVAKAVADFSEERAGYFQRVEAEVVQLALTIARKILHREAQVDPMLLASLVRAALTELNQSSPVTLHVEPGEVAAWEAFFAKHSPHRLAPQVVADAAVSGSQCMILSEVGSTEISIDSQLAEIEHGFFDLLAERPRGESTSGAVQ